MSLLVTSISFPGLWNHFFCNEVHLYPFCSCQQWCLYGLLSFPVSLHLVCSPLKFFPATGNALSPPLFPKLGTALGVCVSTSSESTPVFVHFSRSCFFATVPSAATSLGCRGVLKFGFWSTPRWCCWITWYFYAYLPKKHNALPSGCTDLHHQQCRSGLSLHSLCRIYCCRIFDEAILINVRWYLIVHLICFSLRTHGGWASFYVLYSHLYASSLENGVSDLWLIFLIGLFGFWYCTVHVLFVCWYKLLCVSLFARIFSILRVVFFPSLVISFAVQFLTFIRSHIISCFKFFSDSRDGSQMLHFMSKCVLILVFSFIVSVLSLRSLIYLQSSLCMKLVAV